ncbi:hypothetical protein BCA37_18270 [Mycobacterium sp. djl-10]|nr:hypothetical protein BCA37_18270 [Mycobacterium sp. djl-10]
MTSEVVFGPAPKTSGVRRLIWQISAILARIELAAATVGLILLVVLILLQAGTRIGLDLGLSWPGEASRYLFIWSSFLGGAAAVHWKEEIRVDVLTPIVERVTTPDRAPAVILNVQRTSAFLAACFFTYLAVLCVQQVMFLLEVGTVSVVMGLPMWTVGAALLVAAVTSVFHYVAVLLNEPLADELLTRADSAEQAVP